MSKSPRPPKPIESFGPELFRALIEGSKRRIEFELPYDKATHFRQRINQLRNQMRLQGHEMYRIASQARISISWPEGTETLKSIRGVKWPKNTKTPCKVVISPSDSEFADVLKGAGVEIPPPPPLEDGDTVAEDVLESYVKEKP